MKGALAFLIVGAVLVCVHARPADDPAAAATTPAAAPTPAAPTAPAAAPPAPDAASQTTPATDPQPNSNIFVDIMTKGEEMGQALIQAPFKVAEGIMRMTMG